MARQEAAYEARMLVDRSQPAPAEARAIRTGEYLGAIAADQLPGDRPVDQPDRGLQRARPVGPPAAGAGAEPALQVLPDHREVARIAAEGIGLRQRDEMQVAIQFPEVLDVADPARIAVVEQLSETERRLGARLGI